METDETQYFAKFRAAARPECRFQNIAGGAYMPFCGMCAAFGYRMPAASRFLHAWQSGEARGLVAAPVTSGRGPAFGSITSGLVGPRHGPLALNPMAVC